MALDLVLGGIHLGPSRTACQQLLTHLQESLALVGIEGRGRDGHRLGPAPHPPETIGAVMTSRRSFWGRGCIKLGQGPHGGALKQGVHESIGDGFKPRTTGGHRGGLQGGAGQAGMGRQGTDAGVGAIQPALELEGENHIGQLALAVRLPAAVAALALEIFEIDSTEVLGSGGDIDDAGISLTLEQGKRGPG